MFRLVADMNVCVELAPEREVSIPGLAGRS